VILSICNENTKILVKTLHFFQKEILNGIVTKRNQQMINNMTYKQLIEQDNFREVKFNSRRTVSLTDQQAEEITGFIIPRAIRWIAREMYNEHQWDIEFLLNIGATVEYDKHLSQSQINKFFHIVDQVPQVIESGLL